nr:PREDICTED: GDP-fucose transporter 1 [Bemisia tabaci]
MSVDRGLLGEYVRIASVIAIYWVVSITTVFVNKTLLSSDIINLDAPFFITWFQCVTTSVICYIIILFSRAFPQVLNVPQGSPWKSSVIKKMLPLSILFMLMISFNNLCLKHVGVTFYYIGRSLTTVFNVILTYYILGQTTSLAAIFCCFIIISGFLLGVSEESFTESFSLLGTIYGVLGSLSLALFTIQTKKALPFVENHIWLLSYYNNIYSCFLFLPLFLFTNDLSVLMHNPHLADAQFWLLLCLGGACGFSIGYATALQIKVTSPLTHNVSGTAKACCQTVLASFFEDKKPWLWWISNWVVLFGSAAYTSVKQREMERAREIASEDSSPILKSEDPEEEGEDIGTNNGNNPF